MLGRIGLATYLVGDFATFIYLLFFDGTRYNLWNWLIIVPLDFVLAMLWPIYWGLLRPLLG